MEKMEKNGFKYFIGYKNYEKVNLLSFKIPNIGGYVNSFQETKYMSFWIKNDDHEED